MQPFSSLLNVSKRLFSKPIPVLILILKSGLKVGLKLQDLMRSPVKLSPMARFSSFRVFRATQTKFIGSSV